MNKTGQSLAEKTREIDRGLDWHVEKLSKFIWPIREIWLLFVVGYLFILDYISTYFALQNANTCEDGLIAGWALRTGGFPLLFLADMIAAGTLSLVALGARFLYHRSGFKGYGRAAFVVVLVPYALRTLIVVVNNFVLGFH